MTGLNGNATDISFAPLIPFGMTSFVVVERTTRIVADDPQFAGFEADVRSNLAGFERERLIAGLDEIDAAQRAIFEKCQGRAQQIDAEREDAVKAADAARIIALQAETTDLLATMEREVRDLKPRKYPLIAPYIHAWNVFEPDEQGGYREVPPPRVSGSEVFAKITVAMADWLVASVVMAYRSGNGLRASSISPRTPDGLGLPVGGPNIDAAKAEMRRSRPSQRKSSTP